MNLACRGDDLSPTTPEVNTHFPSPPGSGRRWLWISLALIVLVAILFARPQGRAFLLGQLIRFGPESMRREAFDRLEALGPAAAPTLIELACEDAAEGPSVHDPEAFVAALDQTRAVARLTDFATRDQEVGRQVVEAFAAGAPLAAVLPTIMSLGFRGTTAPEQGERFGDALARRLTGPGHDRREDRLVVEAATCLLPGQLGPWQCLPTDKALLAALNLSPGPGLTRGASTSLNWDAWLKLAKEALGDQLHISEGLKRSPPTQTIETGASGTPLLTQLIFFSRSRIDMNYELGSPPPPLTVSIMSYQRTRGFPIAFDFRAGVRVLSQREAVAELGDWARRRVAEIEARE